jgi:thymidylate kinase
MNVTIYLAVDGCHGTGTSTHADALAEALRGELFDARAYHHPRHPDGCDSAARVAWYAGARAQLAEHPIAPIVVMDRGPMSGVVYAHAARLPTADVRLALEDSNHWTLDRGLVWVWLDAPDTELDARILARNERPAAFGAERAAWRQHVRSLVPASRPAHLLNTGVDAASVRADLLAWAIGVIVARMGAR